MFERAQRALHLLALRLEEYRPLSDEECLLPCNLQQRHDGLPKAIIDRAWDAHLRLCKRYRKLVAGGKHRNVAVIAIAWQLASIVWDIARMTSHPRELQPDTH